MLNLKEELDFLIGYKLLPDNKYISAERFTTQYANTNDFYLGIGNIAMLPIANGVTAIVYGMGAIWAALKTIGNLLILKPNHAANSAQELGIYTLLSLYLAVMAPVQILSSSLELLTRIVSSWFTGEKESTENLSKVTFINQWLEEANQYKGSLPSSTYFNKSRFFSPYNDVITCLRQAAAPFASVLELGFGTLSHAVLAVFSAINGISNLIICKPQHALADFKSVGVHTSLTLTLAVMTVVNPLVETAAFISRLGSTWVTACMQPETEASESSAQVSPSA